MGRLTLILAASLLAFPALSGCEVPPTPDPGVPRVTFLTIPSFDGHNVPVSVYRPQVADPVPVILHSHGWGGTRETRLEAFRAFTDAGLAVVSIDMRGHGEARATSQSRVASPHFEGRDVRAVVDHLAAQPWVLLDAPGDPVLGAMGESYGGAFTLLLAAFDPRLDAIVPRDTWNDLAHAMAPNGVPKSAWFASLWLSGAIHGRIHPDVRQGFEAAIGQGTLPDGSRAGEPDLASRFRASSPANYTGAVRIPTLLIQGVNDTLFDAGEAYANLELVRASGAATALVTHLGGHALSGARRPAMRHPCGEPEELALRWFQATLLDEGDLVETCLALDDGTLLRPAAYPVPGATETRHALGLVRVHPGNLTSRGEASVLVADADMAIVGIPALEGTLPAQRPNATLFWTLEAVAADGRVRTANGQVAPQRLRADGPPGFLLGLAPVSLHLREGETLRLVASGRNDLFADAIVPSPVPIEVAGLVLTLPVACHGC